MDDCVDADMETDENSAFVDVRDRSGIFALNLALAYIFLAGVSVYALDICLYRDVFKGVELDTQDADNPQYLVLALHQFPIVMRRIFHKVNHHFSKGDYNAHLLVIDNGNGAAALHLLDTA